MKKYSLNGHEFNFFAKGFYYSDSLDDYIDENTLLNLGAEEVDDTPDKTHELIKSIYEKTEMMAADVSYTAESILEEIDTLNKLRREE